MKRSGTKRQRPLSPRQQRYAKARARGATQAAAARAAGYKSKRAALVTGSELERDPRVQKIIQVELEKAGMDAGEVKNRLAAQARGESPTLVVRGASARVEYDVGKACERVAKLHGLFKDVFMTPPGHPLEARVVSYIPDNGRARP